MMMRRNSEAAQRAAERRKREDDAARLRSEVPSLASLRFEIEERRGAVLPQGAAYVRHIVVATAPALFLFPCGDRACVDGGHDLTRDIVAALKRDAGRFEGEHPCPGHVADAACANVLHYVGIATYAAAGG